KSSFIAVRLGIVTFLVPFVMIYNPELIAQGALPDILLALFTAMVGVWIIASVLEGYMIGSGFIQSWTMKFLFAVSGFVLFVPGLLLDFAGLTMLIILFEINRKMNNYVANTPEKHVKAK